MSIGQIVALALAVLLVFWMVGAYNRLVSLRSAIGAAWVVLDESLTRRGEATAQLVQALRTALANEHAALDTLLAAHLQLQTAAGVQRARPVLAASSAAVAAAETGFAAASGRVLALVEHQAELRADTAIAPQVQAMADCDVRLVFERQRFNEAVLAYNEAARQFPTRLLARLFGFGTAGRL
jgi:LemA protein